MTTRRCAPPIYHALMSAVEQERRKQGLSMDLMSEIAGTAERSYAKSLHPDSLSGRLSKWETLQLYCDVLFPNGFEISVHSREEKRSSRALSASRPTGRASVLNAV
jgi:hypothetical protein